MDLLDTNDKIIYYITAKGIANNPRSELINWTRATTLPFKLSSRRSSISTKSSAPIIIDDNINNTIEILNDNKPTPIAEEAVQVTTKSKNLPPRTRKYITSALRPNIYITIHYTDIYKEYNPPRLLNVLAEEKYYK